MDGRFLILLPIAFAAGIVTAVSPCVFPVLPILFAGGATGGRRRPYAIIAGLVTSFATFTLIATWLLRQLHLPQDFLRNLSIGLLFLVAASLIFPQRRHVDRAAAGAPEPAQPRQRPGRRLPARREPRPRLRPLRRADHRRDLGERGPRAPGLADGRDHGRLRARRRAADAGDRRARPAGDAPHPDERSGAPDRPRRRAGAGRARARLQRGHEAADLVPGLHARAARGRAQLGRPRRAREAPAPRALALQGPAGRGQARRLRRRARLRGHLRVDQLEAADAAAPAREGRARRLLDLLLHQLPAHAARTSRPGTSATARPGS